ncbi:Replication factor A protein 1 [Leucoagaricus gongylophorus]
MSLIDVIGVVREAGLISDITIRQGDCGRTVKKLELSLIDDTGCSVRVTLWGNKAESLESPRNSVVAFKTIKVGDFGGVSLFTTALTQIEVEPWTEEGVRLRQYITRRTHNWHSKQGSSLIASSK